MIMLYLSSTYSQTDKFRICTSYMEAGILATYSLKFICACKKLLRYTRVTHVQFEDFWYMPGSRLLSHRIHLFLLYKITARLFTKIGVQINAPTSGHETSHFLYILPILITRFINFR